MSREDTFVRITNKDIYESIQKLHDSLNEFKAENAKEHASIVRRQDLTNGKVKLNRWMAGIALTGLGSIVGLILVLIKVL